MKPNQQGYQSNARFEDSTTNKSGFKRWEVQPIQTHKPDECRAKIGEMDLNTMYNPEFTLKQLTKVNAIKPIERRMVDAKFEASTTYRGDFHKWSGARPPGARVQSSYEPSNMPFEGMSTYKGKI
jgi:hypothetical protein